MRDRDLAARRLAELDRVVLLTHERPDGDAVGSVLGLAMVLRALGKHVTPVIGGGMPRRYASLPGADLAVDDLPEFPQPVITVDCADRERCGPPLPAGWPDPVLNIDHHPTNTRFGEINLVDVTASATAEVIFDLIAAARMPLTAEIATALLAGIVTDTIGFSTENVTATVLQKAAHLVERGGRLRDVYEQLLTQRTLAAARYWAAGLARLQGEDGIVWTRLTLADRADSGYTDSDDADLVNFLGTIDTAAIALLFIEQTGGKVKVSWRSRSGIDVSRLALQFGGGGHEPAAGATLEGPLDRVEAAVLQATRLALEADRTS
jgi:phosphoesterase RecJ-like protein